MSDFDERTEATNLLGILAGFPASTLAYREIIAALRRAREDGLAAKLQLTNQEVTEVDGRGWKRGMEEAAKIADAFTLPAHRKMNRDCSLCADVGPHEAIDLTANAIRRRIEERSR